MLLTSKPLGVLLIVDKGRNASEKLKFPEDYSVTQWNFDFCAVLCKFKECAHLEINFEIFSQLDHKSFITDLMLVLFWTSMLFFFFCFSLKITIS